MIKRDNVVTFMGNPLTLVGPAITPGMAASAELAIAEVNASGKFMDGGTVTSVRADSTCIDAAAANAAAERLITAEGINAVMGADCSGVTGAILLVAAFGIYNIISTVVFEKTRDIAILKSLGFTEGDIQRRAIRGAVGSAAGFGGLGLIRARF